jgi:hypothetical protein
MCSQEDNGDDKLKEGERVSLVSMKKDVAPTEEGRKFCKEA